MPGTPAVAAGQPAQPSSHPIRDARRVIRVAIDEECAPFEFVNADGRVDGFTPALLREIGEAAGVTFRFEPMHGPEIRARIENGSIDLISVVRTPQRAHQYDMSTPHSEMVQAIFRRSGNQDIVSLATLSGHTVGLQARSTAMERLADRTDFERRIVHSRLDGLLLLNLGEIDAFLCEQQAGVRLISEYGLSNVELAEGDHFTQDFCFAVRKGDHRLMSMLERHLATLRDSGRHRELVDMWLTGGPTPPGWLMRHRRILAAAGLAAVGLTVLCLLWNLTLRRMVRVRTTALRKNQRRFQALADIAPVGVFRTDAAGDCLYVNPGWCEIAGLTPDQARGRGWARGLHPADRDRVSREWDEAAAAGRTFQSEYRFENRKRDTIWVFGQAVAERDAGGEIVGYVGTVTDITERKRAEEALRRRTRQLRILSTAAEHLNVVLETSAVMRALVVSGMELVDATAGTAGLMRHGNLVFEEYNREGTLQPISYAFEPGVGVPGRVIETHEPYVSNDARHDPRVLPEIRDELGFNNLINVPVLNRSGELLGCFELHNTLDGHPLDGQDVEMLQGLASLAAVALENTFLLDARAEADAGLRRSEERYRIVAETATDAIIIIDETNRIVFVNSATTCMFGYEIQELLGQPLTKLMPERLRSVHTQSFRRYLDTGQRHTAWDRLDVRGLHKCGIEFPIEISLGEQQQDGRHQFTAFIRDMTARTQAEESARQAREQLAHASRLRTIGEMASVLAHEINQPLAALSNFAQGCVQRLRAGHYKEADLLDAMEQITTQARRAGEIISRVRRFARARAPRQRAVDINDVVREAVELAEVEFRRDGLSTRLELAENLPPVDADGIELQQVIVNLVHNGYEACGHTDHKERPLVVRTSRGARDRIEVAVRDFGSGLPDGPPDHVFEPFFTTKQDGMGMGLSISRSIIEAYGGQLVATPNRDRGTTFKFSLPAGGGLRDGK